MEIIKTYITWEEQRRHLNEFFSGFTELCPCCREVAVTCHASKKHEGLVFWKCGNCEVLFQDANGTLGIPFGEKGKHFRSTCPECGGVALRMMSKGKKMYWRCVSDMSHGPFYDNAGKIGQPFNPFINKE